MDSVITVFFEHQLSLKMYHFQTEKYGAHKAADDYMDKYLANFDRFMEVWQGFAGKIKAKTLNVNVKTFDDETIFDHLDSMILFLDNIKTGKDLAPELVNVRDEMAADIQQLKYLLTFE